MRLFFVRNFEVSEAAFVHASTAVLLGIEVVLTRLARENFAILRDFEAFRI